MLVVFLLTKSLISPYNVRLTKRYTFLHHARMTDQLYNLETSVFFTCSSQIQPSCAIVTSADAGMFSEAFVCLFVSRTKHKLLKLIFVKVGVKMAHGPRKKLLDCGDNRGHSRKIRVSVGVRVGL